MSVEICGWNQGRISPFSSARDDFRVMSSGSADPRPHAAGEGAHRARARTSSPRRARFRPRRDSASPVCVRHPARQREADRGGDQHPRAVQRDRGGQRILQPAGELDHRFEIDPRCLGQRQPEQAGTDAWRPGRSRAARRPSRSVAWRWIASLPVSPYWSRSRRESVDLDDQRRCARRRRPSAVPVRPSSRDLQELRRAAAGR